ncbi:hypothetical protein Trydic_g8259 [Trypoxylus dichotomus]
MPIASSVVGNLCGPDALSAASLKCPEEFTPPASADEYTVLLLLAKASGEQEWWSYSGHMSSHKQWIEPTIPAIPYVWI